MKYLYLILLCLVCASFVACKNQVKEEKSQKSKTWSNVSVAKAMEDKASVFLDVRTPEEVAEGMIDGALHIDVQNTNFRSEVDKLDKSKSYVVYCRSGSRSQAASDIMVELGFEEVYNMVGGYNEYVETTH